MQSYLDRFDRLAGVGDASTLVAWLERVAFVFLVMMVLAAPHSIAATQTAWLTGMFAWIVSLALRWIKGLLDLETSAPRELHIALWTLFGWSVLTSLTSYAPDISINKLRGVAIFLIFYFVLYNIRNRRAAQLLAFALIGSCMVNVLWMPIQRLIGRGVEIHGLASHGPLARAFLHEGDALLEADGKSLRVPDDLLVAVEANEITKVKFYRPDFEFVVDVKRADLISGGDAMSRLGFSSWKRSHNWRSSGFYGHYTTYAEVLQLIASLVLGLFVSLLRRGNAGTQRPRKDLIAASTRLRVSASLLVGLAAMSVALLLTVTRASQLAFLISGAVIVVVGLGRRWLVAASALAIPVAIVGLVFLQTSRQVGFFDPNDESIKWRQTVWREGFDLWTASPRNFIVGVGMDSIKRYAGEWHMFDGGRLNQGHFHSTPLNLVVERGLPGLLLWLAILGVYARTLWRNLRSKVHNPVSKGIILGCLGGLTGFFLSGLVHYNLGDQEVAMVFFILMGLAMRSGKLSEPL